MSGNENLRILEIFNYRNRNISMRKILLLSVLLFLFIISAKNIDPDQWNYIQVDSTRAKWGDFAEPEWLRYFGLDFADVNFDGEIDIISGRYVYLNHGGNMESSCRARH